MIFLTHRQVSEIITEAEAAARISGYYGRPTFKIQGSRGSEKEAVAVISTDDDWLSIAIAEEGNEPSSRIQMPRAHFPGAARSFLEGLTFKDPDASPLPLRVLAQGHQLCRSAKDGGY